MKICFRCPDKQGRYSRGGVFGDDEGGGERDEERNEVSWYGTRKEKT
jgi:hypothetical protein